MIGSPDAICSGAAPFAVTAAAAQVYPFAPCCSSVTSSLETPLVPPPPRNPPRPPPGIPPPVVVRPVPGCPVVPVPVCPGGVPIRPPGKPPPRPPPMPPIPAGPAVGIAPACAVLMVSREYAVGPASALNVSTAAAAIPARRAAVRCSLSSGNSNTRPAASTPVVSTTQRSQGCQVG